MDDVSIYNRYIGGLFNKIKAGCMQIRRVVNDNVGIGNWLKSVNLYRLGNEKHHHHHHHHHSNHPLHHDNIKHYNYGNKAHDDNHSKKPT